MSYSLELTDEQKELRKWAHDFAEREIRPVAAKYDEAGKKTSNARITVKHNGMVIHDNIELTKGTPGYKPEGPEKLGLFLQNHGNPVVFKNIWAVDK